MTPSQEFRGLPPEVPGLGDLPDSRHDDVVAALVRTLDHDAAQIEPGDRLLQLRALAGRDRRRRPVLAAACAAAVVAGMALGVGVIGRSPDGTTQPAVPTAQKTPSPPSSVSASSTTPATAKAVAVPVYYLGRDGARLALYREFHRRQVAAATMLATALADAMNPNAPIDPDLSAPWQPSSASVGISGPRDGVITVDLPASEGQALGRTTEQARLAVQQLVWTATAVEQNAQLGVRVLIGGRPGRLFGTVAVGGVVRRAAPAYEVLGSIWVETPAEGQTLSSPITVRGSACTFEANVAWQLLRGGRVVRSGNTTASSGCPVRGTWSVVLGRLDPGRWTFRAYEPPASGQGPDREQTRSFQVR